jgi:SAM-dependent methyltransferase
VASPSWLDLVAEAAVPPPPWTPGTHELWTDPRVAPALLAAHLDPDDDAASRRPATIEATVAWLAAQLPAGGRILDLGCGPGLYASRLAARGFEVTGVDQAPTSLAYARQQAAEQQLPVRYLEGDYVVDLDTELEQAGPFDAVLLIYFDLGVLPPAAVRTVLRRIRRWLADDGVLVFDVLHPRHRPEVPPSPRWGVEERGFWAPEPHLWLTSTHRYEPGPVHLEQTVVLTEDLAPRIYRIWERTSTPAAIEELLAAAGLAVDRLVGDLTGRAFDEHADAFGVVARRALPA